MTKTQPSVLLKFHYLRTAIQWTFIEYSLNVIGTRVPTANGADDIYGNFAHFTQDEEKRPIWPSLSLVIA